ncbi:MAG: GAF domain-containing protein, partial [Anaerolineae bacterium]|nr:GAF domain-containing protein [Anaerolineae bacterium]
IISLSLIFFDKTLMAGDMPKLATLRVLATRDHVFTVDIVDDLTASDQPESLKQLINGLLQGGSSSVPDLRPPYQTMIKKAANFYIEHGIYSTFNLGLRVGSRLLGVMSLGKQVGYEISDLQRNNLFAIADQLALTIENRRLLNDTKVTAESLSTQVRALRIINDLSLTFSTLQDENAVMENTVRALVDALQVDHAGVTLLSPNTDTAVVVSEYPKIGTLGLAFSVKDDEFQRRLRNQTEPIVVNHIATSKDISPETRDVLMKMLVKSIAVIPLIDVRAGFIGSVGIDLYDEKRVFTTDMINFARTITSQMAVTLQNIRLLQNTRRQARQMEAIAGFSQALQTVLDVPSLLKIALEDMQQILSVDSASVILFNASHNIWHRVAYLEGGSAVVVDMTDMTPVNQENTTAGQVIKSQRMFSANDLGKANYRFTFDEAVHNSISLPLLVRGICVGVVEIGNHKTGVYTNTDSAIFQQLVSQVGIGIENAETYTQSQNLARMKALVNDISSQLQKQNDIDQILNVTLNEVGKALGAKRARIRLMTGDEN